MLSATYWVNDNWAVTADNDSSLSLTPLDTVANSGIGDDGTVTGLTFGVNAFDSLTAALAVALDTDTINVISGSYTKALPTITKDVDIIAYNPGDVDLDANSAFTGIFIASTADVLISGISLTNFLSTGVEVQGILQLDNSVVDGALTGIYVNGGSLTMDSTIVRNATIFGVQVGAGGQATISSSELTNDGTAGLIVSSGNATVTGSKISGNTKGVLVNASGMANVQGSDLSGNTSRALENATPALVNASGNWWGFADQFSVNLQRLGLVDFSPFLADGTDQDLGDVGFVADRSELYVTTLGGQAGLLGACKKASIWRKTMAL